MNILWRVDRQKNDPYFSDQCPDKSGILAREFKHFI